MSATGRGTKRKAYDFYSTPTWCTEAIVHEIMWGTHPTILEPCAGDGAIVDVLRARGLNPFYDDINLDCKFGTGCDFLQEEEWSICYDFIITNPPFSLAQEFAEKSLTLANCTVMLLRLNFLASKSRKEFWQRNTPTAIHVLTKRPSFTGKGTDATDYAWFVWDSTGRQKQGIFWL